MMDDKDDVTYRPNAYSMNHEKFQNVSDPQFVEYDVDDDDDDDDEKAIDNEEDEDGGDDGGNGVQGISKDDYEYGDEDDDKGDDYGDSQRHQKKRKLKTLVSSYEFASRVPTPTSVTASAKSSYGGRNPLTDWTEHETFILLDAWGDRYLKQGRKSLRLEEWQEVAEKVSYESKIERTDTQCRNRLDTLKKKYKKEKMKLGDTSEWVYFKKLDGLLSSPPHQTGLLCGLDSGEYVFMNPKVDLNCSNGLEEMRDSPGNSESAEAEEDESDSHLPKRMKNEESWAGAASFKLLADSFQRFSEIYEKIENSKRQQMLELERMRMEFHRDLEMQKRQMLERAQAEIIKIWRGADDEDNIVSAENVSG